MNSLKEVFYRAKVEYSMSSLDFLCEKQKVSKSSFLLHGIKEATEVLKHWMVQKDDTIFPKCVIRTLGSET